MPIHRRFIALNRFVPLLLLYAVFTSGIGTTLPRTFKASRRRSNDRVTPVNLASSGSCGIGAKRLLTNASLCASIPALIAFLAPSVFKPCANLVLSTGFRNDPGTALLRLSIMILHNPAAASPTPPKLQLSECVVTLL